MKKWLEDASLTTSVLFVLCSCFCSVFLDCDSVFFFLGWIIRYDYVMKCGEAELQNPSIIFDSSNVFQWGQKCGVRGACKIYDNHKFR